MDLSTQQPDATVSVSGAKNPTPPKESGGVRSIRIEQADGGFIVNVEKDSPDGGYTPTKPHVCNDAAALHAYIDEAFGVAAAAPAEIAPEPEMAVEEQAAPYEPPAFARGNRESAPRA